MRYLSEEEYEATLSGVVRSAVERKKVESSSLSLGLMNEIYRS